MALLQGQERFYVNFQLRPVAVDRYLPAFIGFAPFYTVGALLIFMAWKLYGGLWRYAGINDMNRIILANLCTTVVQMVGISYWNDADGHKLSQDIAEVYASPGGKERYWEQVPLVYRKEHYSVEVRECHDEDIVEIDTFKELKAIDKTYDV